jgi:hypothetical protein
MNSNSWRDVAARLEAFAEGHYQIQRFSVGEIGDIDKQQLDATYPLMFAIHPNITPVNGALNYALEIVFVDLARDFEEKGTNQVQVISDLARIALDLISEIKNGTVLFGDEVAVVGNQAQIDTGAQQFNNNLCVARLTFSLEIPFEWNACEIPADYAPGGSGQLPGGGYPSWCDKLIYCPVIIQILADLNNKLEFVSVDGVTIVGDGTPGNPLEAVGGGGGGSGTVTSVDVTADGDAINPTGGPVTTSGAINLEFNGASTDYIDGEGNLQAFPAIPTGTVESVTGESVDITDPANPVVNAWPLAGTGTDLANGTIEVDSGYDEYLIKQVTTAEQFGVAFSSFVKGCALSCVDTATSSVYEVVAKNGRSEIVTTSGSDSSSFSVVKNAFSDSATYPVTNFINSKRWNFNGIAAPTLTDDGTLGYGIDSGFIHDGTLYICQDATTGAAVWVAQGGGSAITLETDGTPNGSQALLNLIGGTNIALSDDGLGNVTIDQTGEENYIVLSSNFDVTSAAETDITPFTFALEANSVYIVKIDLALQCSGTSGMQFGFKTPVDATMKLGHRGRTSAATLMSNLGNLYTGNTGLINSTFQNAASAAGDYIGRLTIRTVTAGTFQMTMASVIGAQTSTVRDLSTLAWKKIS